MNLAWIIQGVLAGKDAQIEKALELLGKDAKGIRMEELRRKVIDLRGYTKDVQDQRRALKEVKRAL